LRNFLDKVPLISFYEKIPGSQQGEKFISTGRDCNIRHLHWSGSCVDGGRCSSINSTLLPTQSPLLRTFISRLSALRQIYDSKVHRIRMMSSKSNWGGRRGAGNICFNIYNIHTYTYTHIYTYTVNYTVNLG
jgi:hypothetical protein